MKSSPEANDFGSTDRFDAYAEGWEYWGDDAASAAPGQAVAVVTGDEPTPKRIGPDDPAHNSARDLIDHITADRVTKPARDAVRKALDTADAPKQGKLADGAHRAPEGLGKALRGLFSPIGLRTL